MSGNRFFLVLARVIALWALFLPGSAEASDSCFVRLASEEETGQVHEFYPQSDEVLIGADTGVFRLEGDELRRLDPAEETGGVHEFYPQGDALLVGAVKGLFQLDDDDLRRLAPEETTGAVLNFQPHADAMLVGAADGLFLLEGGKLRRVAPREETGAIFFGFRAAGHALLVFGMRGVFQFEDGNLRRVGAEEFADPYISPPELFLHDDLLLVGADEGLFELEGDDLRRLAPAEETGGISGFYQQGAALLVGARGGLFRFEGGDLRRLAPAEETGVVSEFYQQGDAVLVGAEEGLFRLEGDDLSRIAPTEETGWVFDFNSQGDAVLIGAEEGVFRLEGDNFRRLTPPGIIHFASELYTYADAVVVFAGDGLYLLEGGDVRHLGSWEGHPGLTLHPQGDALLVGYWQGLFRIQPAPPLSSAWAQPERAMVDAYAGEIPFRFSVQHPCISVWSADRVALVAVDTAEPAGATSNVSIIRSDLSRATITGQIDLGQRGTYLLQLAIEGDGGERVPFGEPIEFRVGWTLRDEIGHAVNRAWPFLLFAHTLLFVGLIAGARWSDRCWLLVTDPAWGRLGLWFHFALRHFGPLQRWVMTRWFDRVRRSLTPSPYLPMPLAAESGEVVASSDLLEWLAGSRRLWLQGNAGMGKTLLMRHLADRFFADPELPSVFAAYRRFGFVPIFVALREFLAIRPDDGHPERWVPELARAAVGADGVAFGDTALFMALLTSGGFAVILDGANEVEHGKEIELFAKATPGVRVLVTSQALPSDAGQTFETLRLPVAVGDAILPLLRLFLGAARGDQVYEHVKSSPLLGALHSGYDVRLLADLAQEDVGLDRLPDDRLGLYDAILSAVRLPDGSPYPVDRMCQAAWRMWRDGERKLKVGGACLPPDLLEPLRSESNRVVRTLDGVTFEFRHDQMRAYLAARWVVGHEVAPVRLLEENAAIWRLGRSEQEVLWGFVADLIEAERGVELWRWATRDPERAILQHALQERGEQQGWPLQVITAA